MLPATLPTVGDFFIGTTGFFVSTGGGVDLRSSRLSRLLRISAVVFVSMLLRLEGMVVSNLLSNDFRYAATFPVIMPESLRESFDPKLSIRLPLVLLLLVLLLLLICNFVVDEGRSGVDVLSFTGDAAIEN